MAVLIDFENISSTNHVETVLEFSANRGTVVVKKAFGDWTGPIEKGQEELTKLGVELVHQMGIGKGRNGCDMRLVIDAMDLLHDATRPIDTFVLATCDVDFVPLVVRLRSAGKVVVGAGRPEVASDLFKRTVDEFIDVKNRASRNTKSPRFHQQRGTDVVSFDRSKPSRSVNLKPSSVRPISHTPTDELDSHTQLLILNAMFDVSERNNGVVKGASLHQSMKAIDPSFDYKKYGFDNFADFLARDGDLEIRGRGQPGDITVWIKAS